MPPGRASSARGVAVTGASSVYETAPQGEVLDQPDFLNACLRIETDLEPEALLDLCKEVERELGRVPGGPRHGPRPVDVDLLLLGSLEHRSERLRLPHPEIATRRFVLEPLLELDAELRAARRHTAPHVSRQRGRPAGERSRLPVGKSRCASGRAGCFRTTDPPAGGFSPAIHSLQRAFRQPARHGSDPRAGELPRQRRTLPRGGGARVPRVPVERRRMVPARGRLRGPGRVPLPRRATTGGWSRSPPSRRSGCRCSRPDPSAL